MRALLLTAAAILVIPILLPWVWLAAPENEDLRHDFQPVPPRP